MNTKNGKDVHIFRFIFANIGIYFVVCFISFLLVGNASFGNLEASSALLLAFMFSVLFKNLLTYQTLFSTRLIYYLEEKNNYLLPCIFIIDAIIVIILYQKNQDPAFALFLISFFISISNSFSILSFMLFRKIKNKVKTPKFKILLFSLIKIFCWLFYFGFFIFILMNFILPKDLIRDTNFMNISLSRTDYIIDIILIFIYTIFAVAIENLASLLIFNYFKLIRDYTLEIKKKIIKFYYLETIFVFVISLFLYHYIIS